MGKGKRFRYEKKEKPLSPLAPVVPKTVENDATGFKLYIPRHIHDKVMYWVNKSNYEVSGFGALEYDEKENWFVVTDVILLKQKVHQTSTEMDPHAIGKAMYRLRDQPGALKWHWHSHVNMEVFWSSDDMEVIRSLGQQGWIVASVFNKKEEVRSAFYTTTQVMGKPHDIFVDELDTEVYHSLSEEDQKSLDEEYVANVEVEKIATVGVPVHYPGGRTWAYPEASYYDSGYGGADEAELMELQSESWANAATIEKYNEQGYAMIKGEWIYNPLHDAELKTETQQFLTIEEMDDDEIDFLQKHDTDFAKFLQRYLVALANGAVV